MPGAFVKCSRCSCQLEPEEFAANGTTVCRGCHKPLTAAIFPALWKPQADARPETLIATEEASCFYHQANRAVIVCDGCGRFLCKLCDVDIRGQHLCPACIESGVKKKNVAALDHNRVIYGRIAFWLTVAPLFMWPFTCITAPAAVFIAIRYWNRPGSLTGGGHGYHVFAIIFGLLEIAGWLTFLTMLILK
jgi:hypothetical protein